MARHQPRPATGRPAAGRPAGRGALRNSALAGLLAAGLVGYLLWSGAFDPVLTSVASRIGGPVAGPVAAGPATKQAVAQQAVGKQAVGKVAWWWTVPVPKTTPTAPEWSRQRLVPTVPQPAQPTQPEPPQIQPPEDSRRLIVYPPPMPTVSLAPPRDCPHYVGPPAVIGVGAVAGGGGQVTVSWFDPNDPATTAYRVVALPRGAGVSGPMTFTAVTPPKSCIAMTATVTGLKSGRYEFWLEATDVDPLNHNLPFQRTVGRSDTITVT